MCIPRACITLNRCAFHRPRNCALLGIARRLWPPTLLRRPLGVGDLLSQFVDPLLEFFVGKVAVAILLMLVGLSRKSRILSTAMPKVVASAYECRSVASVFLVHVIQQQMSEVFQTVGKRLFF